MLRDGRFNKERMRIILSHYKDQPAVLNYKIPTDAKILRSSLNADKIFHTNVSRLNYPPVKHARTERASLEGKPMFYACIFTSAYKDGGVPRVFSALETTDILRGYEKEGKVFTTQSLWKCNRDLNLIAFPFSKKYSKPCEEVIRGRSIWNKEYSVRWPREYVEFSEYISDLIATPVYSCLYDITANTIDCLLHDSTLSNDVDGIMYPSIWGDGEGMNICLKPDVVDRCVHFESASVQMIVKEAGNAKMFGIADSILLPDGELKWKPTDLAFELLQKAYGLKRMFNEGMVYFD